MYNKNSAKKMENNSKSTIFQAIFNLLIDIVVALPGFKSIKLFLLVIFKGKDYEIDSRFFPQDQKFCKNFHKIKSILNKLKLYLWLIFKLG